MKGMMIYEGLTHIDDTFILGSMPPATAAPKAPRFPALSQFLNSGVGAAVISGVVALGVLVAIVMAGRIEPVTPPVTTDQPPLLTEDSESETPAETETKPELTYSQGLEYTKNSEGFYIVSGMGTCKDTDIVIPPTYEDQTVIGIDSFFAFRSNATITSVIIPSTITRIEDGTFRDCTALTSVTLPDTMTEIGTSAFKNCSALTSIVIPDTVIQIGDSAFKNCTALTSVSLSNGIRRIGSNVFFGCSQLEYNKHDNANYLGNEQNPFLAFIRLPSSLRTSCEVHESTKLIADNAFSSCESLTSLTLPDGLEFFGTNYFDNSPNLTYNTYKNAQYLGNESNPYVLLVKATDTSIATCEIPETTKLINHHAFSKCKLRKIVIPESVIFIGRAAFYQCSQLTDAVILGNVDVIRNDTFYYCTKLTSVTIPDSVIRIEDGAFENCALKSITLPDGLTYIGESAFWENGITELIIPDSVTYIGERAFFRCGNLASVTLSKGLTAIHPHTFDTCLSLTSIIIPDGVITIGSNAFNSCYVLKSVTLPDSLTHIDTQAFSYCSALISVDLPKGVTSVGKGAFSECANLTTVTIPKSVTSFDYAPFAHCTALTDVYYAGSEEEWNNISKDVRFPKGATIHFNHTP